MTGVRTVPSWEVTRHETQVALRSYDERLDRLLAKLRDVPAQVREILDARR